MSPPADLAQILPELRQLLAEVPQPLAPEPEGPRFRMFEAASAFLRSIARDRPLVLVLDDLHAADEPALLRFVAREISDSPLARDLCLEVLLRHRLLPQPYGCEGADRPVLLVCLERDQS